jgi:hypothetical protein
MMAKGLKIAVPSGSPNPRYFYYDRQPHQRARLLMSLPTDAVHDPLRTKISNHPRAPAVLGTEEINQQRHLEYPATAGLTLREVIFAQSDLKGGLDPQLALSIMGDVVDLLCSIREKTPSRYDLRSQPNHENLTAENIFLSDRGEIFFHEWGLPRLRSDAAVPGAAKASDPALPPHYRDIRACGMILWEMLTGLRFEDADTATGRPLVSVGYLVPAHRDEMDQLIRVMLNPPRERFATSATWLVHLIRALRLKFYPSTATSTTLDLLPDQVRTLFVRQRATLRRIRTQASLDSEDLSITARRKSSSAPRSRRRRWRKKSIARESVPDWLILVALMIMLSIGLGKPWSNPKLAASLNQLTDFGGGR